METQREKRKKEREREKKRAQQREKQKKREIEREQDGRKGNLLLKNADISLTESTTIIFGKKGSARGRFSWT